MNANKDLSEVKISVSEKAELLTTEAAARILGFLARWAARRMQQRQENQAEAEEIDITNVKSKDYTSRKKQN